MLLWEWLGLICAISVWLPILSYFCAISILAAYYGSKHRFNSISSQRDNDNG